MKQWMHRDLPSFVTYQIEIKTKKNSEDLIFEDLWIDEKRYKFRLIKQDRKIASSFNKAEVLRFSIISELKDDQNKIPPKAGKGILILTYKFKDKLKHISVKKLKQIDLKMA